MNFFKAISVGRRIFFKELLGLLHHPVFIFVTIAGNFCIFLGGTLFYLIEPNVQAHPNGWFDSIYWAFATVTTVGYGDISAQTNLGKLLSIVLMVIGSGFFWTYAALFAGAIISSEYPGLNSEAHIKKKKPIS